MNTTNSTYDGVLPKREKSPLTKTVRIIVAVAGTLALLVLGGRYLSLDVLKDSVHNLRILPILGAIGVYTTVTAVRAGRFVLAGADITFGDAFSVAAVHAALLRVMPFRSGELAYAIMLKKMGKGELGQGIATVAMLRLLDLAVVMVMAASSVSAYFAGNPRTVQLVILLISFAAMGIFFFASTSMANFLDRVVRPAKEREKVPFWAKAVGAVSATLRLTLKRRILLIASTAFLWFLMLTWFYLLMRGVGVTIDYQSGLSAGMLGIVGSILPLSVVGSFGPMEGGFALGFVALGFTAEVAATRAVLLSSFSLINNWLIAIPGWIWYLTKSVKNK